MSDTSAIRLLQTAIENVREQCSGSEYKDLLASLDRADSEAEKVLGEPDDSAQDKTEENQPRNLKSAEARARQAFAARRKADSENK